MKKAFFTLIATWGIIWILSGLAYLSSEALLKDLDNPLSKKAPLYIQEEIQKERENTARGSMIAGISFKIVCPAAIIAIIGIRMACSRKIIKLNH